MLLAIKDFGESCGVRLVMERNASMQGVGTKLGSFARVHENGDFTPLLKQQAPAHTSSGGLTDCLIGADCGEFTAAGLIQRRYGARACRKLRSSRRRSIRRCRVRYRA